MLKFNQYMKLDKMIYIIYGDFESLIQIIDGYANNLEKSSTFFVIFNVDNLGI